MRLLPIAIAGLVLPIIGALCFRIGRPRISILVALAAFGAGLLLAYSIATSTPRLHVTPAARAVLLGLGGLTAGGMIYLMSGLFKLREVRFGALILAISLGLVFGLFLIVGLERLSLENGATVLSCAFGILITFYLLHRMNHSDEGDEVPHDSSRDVTTDRTVPTAEPTPSKKDGANGRGR